ncbi:Opacity protein LomR and related surface antigens (LomR) (PDB:1Q9F) [Commensalibacter communis]|uniref:outer membrane protein n=1 Tax=Commensalibacter communis TaxID=2972786 RepID=UPI0022FF755F|nr:outer membrane beta-barrel protein [Commensalibacter communis]CAI3922194.1 Opacity protein LomR and related surface antigens (LomR) (PDB:1Q9F) [Commensalibacter communis]CAI3937699.1 Opacity protein LomR and related surface antigens (LomR) (PDB:1Q9F) [Commensalibacter communis]
MKKYFYLFCASSLSFFCTQNGFAETTNPKSGFYITGKVGASILQQKKQSYNGRYQHYDYDYYSNSYTLYNGTYNSRSGGTHTNTRLGGGISVGYNFDNYFKVPIRAEIDVMARMKDSSHYLSDRYSYHYDWMPKINEDQHVDNKVQLNTFMFNAFYDFKNKSAFTPYLMAGVGLGSFRHTSILTDEITSYGSDDDMSYNKFRMRKNSRTKNNFAWNAGVGVRYKINDSFDLDFSYRYLDAGKSSLTMWRGSASVYSNGGFEKSKTKVITQDIMLGLTYNF